MRVEIVYTNYLNDGRAHKALHKLQKAGCSAIDSIVVANVFLINRVPALDTESAGYVFCDPVAETAYIESSIITDKKLSGWSHAVEVTYKPGVTDPLALTAREAIARETGSPIPPDGLVQSARLYLFYPKKGGTINTDAAASTLYNPLIQMETVCTAQDIDNGTALPEEYPSVLDPSPIQVDEITLEGLSGAELETVSKERLLSLTVAEMEAVQAYYRLPEVKAERKAIGLPEAATDVELEMIAQTWSEHCKHKIFQADIEYTEAPGSPPGENAAPAHGKSGNSPTTSGDEGPEAGSGTNPAAATAGKAKASGKTQSDSREYPKTINSLFSTYIKDTTDRLWDKKPYLRSVFHDNSGVIQFDEDTLLCFKTETHNSPSALDPYGGSITGIVGVNRDIMGTGKGAKPIFNTNVLCFGYPDTDPKDVPENLKHPFRVLDGVHQGIVDGGNQSGIPVAGGAFVFDESYTGKPLVFCGTGGILPAEIGGEGSWINHIDAGDKAVMLGGRIGKDGIHGATFSSLALDETSPTSAVQIGDPIIQKRMLDVILVARDRQLFKGITDNGAGGLSSSLGEMAEKSGGVKIILDRCPLKYPGLAPWEILVSESQERMSLAVDPAKLDDFLALCSDYEVEASVVGEFTDTGAVEVFYDDKPVGRLGIDFLHDGVPRLKLSAEWKQPVRSNAEITGRNLSGDLEILLAEPNIASKEPLIRQYDHEVQAQSVIKPFTGHDMDAPSDGAVLKVKDNSNRGITVTHGICPWYSRIDTYHMAACAVDEAMRAHVAMGGDPDYTAGQDNFCWPDPVESAETPDGKYKLAQLVRACKGLQDTCLDYGVPLISGKDSMKNDARTGGRKISVQPTLLISLMGIVESVHKSVNTDFLLPGHVIFAAGETRDELAGSFYERISGLEFEHCPTVHTITAMELYRRMHKAIQKGLISSCHDVSDGGIAVALAESAIGAGLGVQVYLEHVPKKGKLDAARILFSESPSRFIVSAPPEHRGTLQTIFLGLPFAEIGSVIGSTEFCIYSKAKAGISDSENTIIKQDIETLKSAWKSREWE